MNTDLGYLGTIPILMQADGKGGELIIENRGFDLIECLNTAYV